MLIAQLQQNEAEDLKIQFTLQGMSQVGSQKYETIRILIPESKPFKFDDSLTLVDSELYVATRQRSAVLFNRYVYIHELPEQDVMGLIDNYEIEEADICHINRFYYGEDYNDFVTSPMFNHTWLYSRNEEPYTEDEEEIYDYD